MLPASVHISGPFLRSRGGPRHLYFSLSHTGLETQIHSLHPCVRLREQAVGRGKAEKGTPLEVVLTFQVGKTGKKLLRGRRGLGME